MILEIYRKTLPNDKTGIYKRDKCLFRLES